MKMYYYFVICHQEQGWQLFSVITAQAGQQSKSNGEKTNHRMRWQSNANE